MKQAELLSIFWSAADNCVAVAFIKAMLAGKQLCKIKNSRGKLYLSLKDKTVISFTSRQIKLMNTGNGIRYRRFPQQKKLRQQVEVLFALLILQLQLHGYAGQELTQSKAKKLLVDGIATRTIHRWLGVKQTRCRYKKSDWDHIRRLSAILVFNQKHIAFTSKGYFDQGGTPVSLKDAATTFPFGPPTHYYKFQ